MSDRISTSYDVDIAEAMGRYLKPVLAKGRDNTQIPALEGIPEFLKAVHDIIEAL